MCKRLYLLFLVLLLFCWASKEINGLVRDLGRMIKAFHFWIGHIFMGMSPE